ncbi:ATP-binding protein [Stackebrandtia nassauensis]|uniref:Transcriptional regulator, XRE family n=1 Tax=Stackebrandtia nassauensis (strain DSM 44728 / CIP 108903 / NRRL B-16338 / NBRC 102104 / LLR-40K-21) TaxID=446470 RepID=D3PWS3_STANL|nr:helix-turn-helix transcriptional regulator [Stackebrandtia nassauensis]ADD43295.1 transcriptional regulator, XRE family [Stackebrandtia nassauensis DSM 44728]
MNANGFTIGCGRLLRAHRLRAGLAQEDLARISGVSVRGIRMIENEQRRPRVSTVRTVAQSLRLSEADRLTLMEAAQPDSRPPQKPENHPRRVVPRQLPASPRGFVAREAELGRLDAALKPPTSLLCSVTGLGGMGKTWLAVHWATTRLDRFPDGQLYVNLRGFDPVTEPTPPYVGLRAMVSALGVPVDSVPADVDELAALFRSITADKRLLMVLDNARDAAQVAPMLPGGDGSAAVVTSRSSLCELVTEYGARSLRLGGLTADDSRRLLGEQWDAERIAREPDAVEGLISRCAGLPLALGIVAAHGVLNPDHPLGTIYRNLVDDSANSAEDGDDIVDDIRVVFDTSLRLVGGDASRLFDLLGLASGSGIDVYAAASLAGLPVPAARGALRELENAHLVSRDSPGRYRMHDLTYRFAAARSSAVIDEPETVAALHRLINHYILTGYRAGDAMQQGDAPVTENIGLTPRCVITPMADRAAAFDWVRREIEDFPRYQAIALAHGWYETAWRVADCTRLFIDEDAINAVAEQELWRVAIDAAEHLGPMHLARAQSRFGNLRLKTDPSDSEAVDLMLKAADLAAASGEVAECARTHFMLAHRFQHNGQKAQAIVHAKLALAFLTETEEPVMIARVHNMISWTLGSAGRFHDARRHGELALAIAREYGLSHTEATVLGTLGSNSHKAGRHAQAERLLRRAYTIHSTMAQNPWSAISLENLGDVLADSRHPDQASEAWRRATILFEQTFRIKDAERVRTKLDSL